MPERDDERLTFVYDTDLRRPGCVLLQAAYGCQRGSVFSRLFPAETWLVAPTPGMRRISGTIDEWERAAAITKGDMADA